MSLRWYEKGVLGVSAIQQAEVFILHGDVNGFPELQQETLPEYLRRMTLARFCRRLTLRNQREKRWERERITFADWEQNKQVRQELAAECVFATLSQSTSLSFADPNQEEAFNEIAPPPDNPYATATPGGTLRIAFEQVDRYLCSTKPVPALTLVIKRAHLIFPADGFLVDPESTLLDHLQDWAETPLFTDLPTPEDPNVLEPVPHILFLIAPSLEDIRPQLRTGRIAPVNIPLPNEEERQVFIENLLAGAADELEMEAGLDVKQLGRLTGALHRQQIEDVIYRAKILDGGVLRRAAIRERKDEQVRTTYGGVMEIEYPDVDFEDIVGFETLKAYFEKFAYPLLVAGDPSCPKGCLLTGNPGTGKTLFAMGLAAALNLPLVKVSAAQIKDKWVGSSTRNMALLCEGILALVPAVILFDEIDKMFAGAGGGDSSGVSDELVGQLQTFMSDIPRGQAFFIGTTNYPSRIPPAMLRPGRFEQVLPMLPQHMDRLRHQLIHLLAIRMNIPLAQIPASILKKLGEQAANYTGADIEKLLSEAHCLAVMAEDPYVTEKHLSEALEYVVPTLTTTRDMLEEAVRYTSNLKYVPEELRPVDEELADPPAARSRRGVRRRGAVDDE